MEVAFEKEIELISKISNDKRGPIKASDILNLGIHYKTILELEKKEILIRIKNGYYALKTDSLTEEELVCGLVPGGVFTMDTALYYHGYIDKCPKAWSIAVSKNVSKSRFNVSYPSIIPYYTEPRVLDIGAKDIPCSNGIYRIYTKDRLICDILKYENRLSYTVFQKALRSYLKDEEKQIEDLLLFSIERKVQKKVKDLILPWIPKRELEQEKKDIQKVNNDKDEDTVPPIESEEDIAKAIYDIEKNDNIHRLHEVINNKSINGVKVWKPLKEIYEKANDIPNLSGLESLKDSEEGKAVLKFITPIYISIISDEVFFGDWMPDLGRFL